MGHERITLNTLQSMKAVGRKIAMLTAYDHPTAVAAQAAGIHSLLIGDSMGTVLLGHANTRDVPLELMLVLGEAVRRGAPDLFLIGDMPYGPLSSGDEAVTRAAQRFVGECGCNAVKLECESVHAPLVGRISSSGIIVVAHLGLRPQSILSPDGYRAQARDALAIERLVADARTLVAAGAAMLLLEAVPPEAARAVISACDVPVIGCGAGPDCDGHVVVTHDMLGIGTMRPPRFVPVLEQFGQRMTDAMKGYAESIAAGEYPGPQHCYGMRATPAEATEPR
ncbi:MAG: 3-methyl-2-oxobutanoate hydroxymethyltransferase [Phycisphaerae bacterium]